MAARWYVLHVYSGFENKVAETIREKAVKAGMEEVFQDVVVPMEEVVELKRGAKTKTEKKFFPGYVLVKMDMSDEAEALVRQIPRVTGFLGANNNPSPITKTEAERLMNQVVQGAQSPTISVAFEVGETVEIADGAFASFSGLVEEVDEARSRLKVSVTIFGRSTPVELDFAQVQKK